MVPIYFMNKIFCSECGAKHEYSINKPKFCSECGCSMSGGGSSKNNDTDSYEDGEEDAYSAAASIQVNLRSDNPRGVKFGDVAGQSTGPSEKTRRASPKIGIQDLIDRSINGNKITID